MTTTARMAGGTIRGREIGSAVVDLDEDECWRYLRWSRVGRLAVLDGDGAVDVFPVNHAVDDRSLVLRTADGGKMRAFTTVADVAYEVDGVTEHVASPRTAWSVVLRGRAEVITSTADTVYVHSLAHAPWQGGSTSRFVRVRGSVTGRRFVVTGSGWWS